MCKSVPIKDNYYLSLFLRGHRGYNPLEKPDFCPPYLREKEFYKLKVVCHKELTLSLIFSQGLVDRIVMHTGSVETYLSESNATFTKVY